MKKIVFLVCIVFLKNIFADCGYSLSYSSINYTIMDSNPVLPYSLSLYRSKNGSRCNQFLIGLTKGWGATYSRTAYNLYSGEVLNYNLFKNSGGTQVLKNPPDVTNDNEVLFGMINRFETKTIQYYFQVTSPLSGTMPRAGSYIDYVQMQVYTGKWFDINDYEGYAYLPVQIIVPKISSLSLVDTGSVFDATDTTQTLDFGELEENEELSFDLMVASNAGYSITFSSLNSGKLKNSLNPSSTVIYDLLVNNSLKNLSSPTVVATNSGVTPVGGTRLPVKIKIKNVDNKDSGIYNDYITITTTTIE